MVIGRGDVCWAEVDEPSGSRPGNRRPVLVVQADSYNRSALATVVAVAITSNTALAAMPGNVFLPAVVTGLPKDSVVNVTAVLTLNQDDLGHPLGAVHDGLMHEVDQGLRAVLGL